MEWQNGNENRPGIVKTSLDNEHKYLKELMKNIYCGEFYFEVSPQAYLELSGSKDYSEF